MESGGDPSSPKPRGALGGRFFLEEKLGEDASGELHRGLDLRSGTTTVVRIVRGEGNARRERLLRDTRRAAGVKHPGLANVLGVGQTEEGDIFVAAETLMGDRLSDRLAMGERFDVHEAAEIATQIAAALAAAHDADVVHRLLRPSLVVLSYEGDDTIVKVEGLGVPRPPTDSDEDPEIAYSAPEQQRGETVGRRADVYSIGAMLYAMITGDVPKPDAPSVGGALADVVAKCLSEDPKDRYVDTAALSAAMKIETDSLPPRVPSKMPMAVSVPPPEEPVPPPASVPQPPPPASVPRPAPPSSRSLAAASPVLIAAAEHAAPPATVSSSPPPASDAAIAEAMKAFETAARVSIIPLSDDGAPPANASTTPPPPADSSSALAFVSSTRVPAAPPSRAPLAAEPGWKTWIMHGPPAPRAGVAAALVFALTAAMVPIWLALVLAILVGGGAFAILKRNI